jgi:hypothetical protein
VTLRDASIYYGQSGGQGGAIFSGGGKVTVTGSRIHNCQAASYGGALANQEGMLTVIDSDIHSNRAEDHGGGIATLGSSGVTHLTRSRLQRNSAGQDNGGPTETHALLPGSPAVDAGDDTACPAADQRGVTRPVDGNGDGTAVCDIGAYEKAVPVPADLLSFVAKSSHDRVTLTWETRSEPETAGYHLWRSESATGTYARITSALIPATGDASSGASYSYTDQDVTTGTTYYYKLEDLAPGGAGTFHGPVSAMPDWACRVYLPVVAR